MDPFRQAAEAATELARVTGVKKHDVFIALGSGWAAVADLFPGGVEVAMADLPGFVAPSATGHRGLLRSIDLGSRRLLLALGRVHLYEGHGAAAVAHPTRTAVAAGCQIVVLTNAAGSIRSEWPVGKPVMISDHINLTGSSPLTGPEPPPPWPGRFVPLTDLYSRRLRAIAHGVEPDLPEGVYVGFHGPEFETPAEIQMARSLGGDLAGMSTVLEAIAARHMAAEVLGLSLVTNHAAGVGDAFDSDHVIDVAQRSADDLARLLKDVIKAVS
ncbi:MAG TPA: purine-nucleoside phosphorylase [Acidimicrobiia bacterium]